MLGNSPLFETKPIIQISPDRKYIEVIGHYQDITECAKLTLLCEKYGATELKNGYAKLPYSEEFLNDLKYINKNQHFIAITAIIAIIVAAAAATAAIAGGIGWGVGSNNANNRNSDTRKWLEENYPDLTEAQIEALIDQYGDDAPQHIFDFGAWGDQSDKAGLQKLLDDIEKAHEKYGDAPEAPTAEDLARLQQEAYDEIDAENQRLLDLYDTSFQNSESMLRNELQENAAMFGDYRNQVLTNEAMRQQALAGSTRFEMERERRNAITRGASAAQRLVANINAQLGLQASSAQQALNTSNALAQNLLAHRQAQQNVRNSYLTAQNQHNQNIASVISGQAERRYNYGQGRKQGAIDDYNYAYDVWNNNIANAGLGSTGEGMYRTQYGSSRRDYSNGL